MPPPDPLLIIINVIAAVTVATVITVTVAVAADPTRPSPPDHGEVSTDQHHRSPRRCRGPPPVCQGRPMPGRRRPFDLPALPAEPQPSYPTHHSRPPGPPARRFSRPRLSDIDQPHARPPLLRVVNPTRPTPTWR